MDEFAIEEAENLTLEGGVKFGDTREGQAVLEMARSFLAAQATKRMPPCNTIIGRKEDMSPNGRLCVLRQDDGDMCVTVIDEDGHSAGVEFCTIGQGGGKSPKTVQALRDLALAIIDDNQSEPSRAATR